MKLETNLTIQTYMIQVISLHLLLFLYILFHYFFSISSVSIPTSQSSFCAGGRVLLTLSSSGTAFTNTNPSLTGKNGSSWNKKLKLLEKSRKQFSSAGSIIKFVQFSNIQVCAFFLSSKKCLNLNAKLLYKKK